MADDHIKLNLVQIFRKCSRKFDSRAALQYKNKITDQYVPITWNDWSKKVEQTALGLNALGVASGTRVGLLAENCPEWTFADLGILSLGAINVPIYPTSSPEEVAYIVDNAKIEILFLSNREHYERLTAALAEFSFLKNIILFEGFRNGDARAMPLDDLLEKGRLAALNQENLYQGFIDRVAPDDPATIIYTSGTTGKPKGVVLSHKNFVANYLSSSEVIKVYPTDTALSFLPLSHVFERMAGYYFMAFHGACIAYAENMQTVPQDMLQVRPTVAASVPRLYEKIYARIQEQLDLAPASKRKIFDWAMKVGKQVSEKTLNDQSVPLGLSLKRSIAEVLVYKKLKMKLGGRMRFFISGGAPLPQKMGEFFYYLGVVILEGYGLTETSPVIAVNSPEALRFGTVGKPLPGVEVKIAEDGEILTRSDSVMQGYYQNDTATAEVIDQEGWFHTGDIGDINPEGYLRITDRKKDIIVTSGGKNISPQNIEGEILADKLFAQVVIIGDKRNYLVALIVPNRTDVEKFAEENSLQSLSWEDLLKHERVYQWVQERLNQRLVEFARYEQIKYFALLPKELSQEAGELTPTLKVKRKVIGQKYADLIDELYRKGESFREQTSS